MGNIKKQKINKTVDAKTWALFENPRLGVYTTDEEINKVKMQRQLRNQVPNFTILLICTSKIIFLGSLIIVVSIIWMW